MLVKAVKNKFRQLFVFLLIATLLIQGVVPAYAGDNGAAHYTPTSGRVSPWYVLSSCLNLAVMLFDGEHNEFVMDNKELTASVEPLYQRYVTEAYAEKFNKEYLDKSVNWAYAQIFRRTQVAWNAPGAVDSLILMGPDVVWHDTGVGTVTMSADQTVVKGRNYFEAHRYTGSPTHGGTVTLERYRVMEKGWHPNWGNVPNGEGVFKSEIKDYLVKKYIDKEDNQPDPDVFFKNLVATADDSRKTKANRVWQYIAAGPTGVKKQRDPSQGPSYRWRKVFEGANRFDSDQVFIGSGKMYIIENDEEKTLQADDPRVIDQIASYFDTLVTLSVVADTGMSSALNKQISEKYLNAAIDCFGSPGAFINDLDELEQKKSIIFDTWTSHAFTSAGNAKGGSAGTYTDIWGAYRYAYHRTKGVPTSDWRSLSIYNDFHLEPLAKDSKAAKTVWTDKGGSIAPETMDRIALRLSTIQADKRPAITDSQLDIVFNAIWFPGSAGLGPTSALLGRAQGGEAETIALGLKADKPTYRGIDNTQLDMVGGQFAVFMYAHKILPFGDDDWFTHGLSVTPKDVVITPRAELNQNIKVIYKFGNDFAPSRDVVLDIRKLGDFVAQFKDWANDPDKQSVLEARTYLTRQVTKYQLDTLWMPGAGTPERVKGITPDTAVYDVPAVATALGTETVPASSFNDFNDGWGEIKIDDLMYMMLIKNCVMFTIDDDSYRSFRWIQDPVPEKFDRLVDVSGERILETVTPGSDFVLEVTYKADTQIRVRHKDGSFETLSYTNCKTDPSVTKFTDAENVPAYLAKAKSGKHEPASDYASFKYCSDFASFKYPEEPKDNTEPSPYSFVKEPMKYAVYSSSPEAYAELKNWGVASYNEPGDETGLGDGRSPVDTDLGVKPSTASNGSDRINEDYEAMAGVPTTEKLYLAVGGSEFIIDIAVQYVPNETAVRTYHVHFDGVKSQYNYASASGAGGDTVADSHWTSGGPIPQVSGFNASVSGAWTHEGGTITLTMSGEIKNDSATRSNTKSDSQSASSAVSASASCSVTNVGKYVATAEAEATADSWGVPTLHNSSASASVTTSVSATTQADPNAADVANFNAAMAAAEKWSNDMVNWINGIPTFISGSDKVGRNINNSTVTSPFIVSKKELTTTQGDTGYLTMSTPDDWFKVKDDGAGDSFNIVSYSLSMSAKNPVDVTATKTGSDSDSDSDSKPCSYVAPTENSPGTPCGKEMAQAGAVHAHSKISVTAQPDPTKTWSATVTFTLKPHVLCGPDCGHNLPEINDIWQQSFNYDYLKIIGLSVLRLDQGSANDETGRGLNALIGTKKLGVTRQTYYSSPTMSLAQANIFNYMGLQTDGTKDVYNATNEYFRSIAYGLKAGVEPKDSYEATDMTEFGNTLSSQANRVQYFMTDADGDVLSVKGTDKEQFPRYVNEGNKEVKTSFADEMQSSWEDLTAGRVDAGDYVYYNFGPRSNLSDGTSRGYKYNIDKSSWVEEVDGGYRGKAAYDLDWAKGFIYDGVQKEGEIDASGFSVSRSLRNSNKGGEMAGIYQNGVKGWQGTGMTTKTLSFKTISYEAPFEAGFFTGQNDEMKKAYGEGDFTKFSTTDETPPKGILYQPAVRDWSKTNHALYSDTRNLLEPGGASMPGATADWSPREVMAKLWTENGMDRADDRYAQTQPYDTDDMLTAFTNTASDGGAKIRNTSEYKLMQAKRSELVYATVISDALVLDLPNGYQPIMYHYKNAPAPAAAEDRIPDVRISFEELWLSNKFTPNGWPVSPKGTPKDAIIIGGYNGDLSNVRTTTADVQHRLRWRADGLPATSNMFIQDKAGCEAPTGIIGKEFGALVLNGYNINRHLGHNINIPTRVLSRPVTNKPAVGNPVQRTLLYNIAPIVLSAENREYSPGKAEVFWETVVMWKDDSNHDYYGKYITGDGRGAMKPDVYMPDGTFVRLPDLLGNYGQKQRNEAIHTIEKGTQLMENYFKYTPAGGSQKLEAYGAAEARAAQAEQYARGFGVTGYNYDTTNKKAIDGKYFKNMYNESGDLTGAAKANSPYVYADTTEGIKVGVPFLVEVVKNGAIVTNYKAETARRSVGSPIAGEPKSGYIQRAAYSIEEDAVGRYELNNIVIHNVVSARATQIMPIAEWRDQRLLGQSLVGAYREENRLGAPGTLDFAILDCKYDKPLELLKLNFIGSGNSVPNQAKDQKTTGNIILAGNFAMTSTGLTSGGSARSGVSLADLGGEYYSALDYQVTAEITYKANTGEQMLFGFKGYGITLNTATKKLYIRKAGATGYLEVVGTFESGNTLKVRFSSSNAALCKVWVNGASRTVTLVGGEYATMSISKNQIAGNFYIGSWESTPAYTMATTTRIKNLLFERLAGSHEHTDECKTITIYHAGGNNTHVHNLSCLGPESSHKYLAGAISAWNNNEIDDAELKKLLGNDLWTQLGMPKKTTEFIKTTTNVTLNMNDSIEVPRFRFKGSQSFGYIGDVQTFTAPGTGAYTFEVWGAQGGAGDSRAGKGGYAKGTVNLTAGEVVYIYVGGSSGYNGGATSNMPAGYGGGATDIRIGSGTLYDRILVAGGGGGFGGRGLGGDGGGLTGNNGGYGYGGKGYGGKQSAGGAGGTNASSGTFGEGGAAGGSDYSNGQAGGGGGWYGGGGGGNDYPAYYDYDDAGAGGGSGYVFTSTSYKPSGYNVPSKYYMTDTSMDTGVRSGDGYATVSYDVEVVGGGTETILYYTGGPQTYTAPITGTYTFELWGAQGGNNGAKGQYVKDTLKLTEGQTVYVYVGGQGKGTDLNGSSNAGDEGGWNGGGNNYNGYGSGGGATDIRIGGTALSNRKLVAGGGAGKSHTGLAYATHRRYAELGQGQHATGHHGGGGGGGYYGGLGGTGCDGVAYSGSSYARGAERTADYSSGSTVVTYGANTGNGKVKITAPLEELEKKYTFTTGNMLAELNIIVVRLSGTSNMKVALHKGAAPSAGNLIKTVTGNPNVTFPATILEPNTTYTIVVSTASAVTTSFNIKATLSTRNLKYSDIVSLPNVNGKAAWEQIPYYLPDGSRNPVYKCNGELNAHVCQLSVGDMGPEASLSMWSTAGTGTLTWDSAEQAYKAVGYVKMYLKPEFSHKIDKNKVYTIKVTAKVSNYSGQRFYWGGQRLDASYNHLNGFGGTYDYRAASSVYTGNTSWVTYTATKTGTKADASGWGTDTEYYALGGLLNYMANTEQVTWVKGIELYEDGVLVQSYPYGVGEPLCFTIETYDNCKEPHHKGAHYENDWLCYSPDLDDTKYDPNFVQNSRVNTKAAEFVSIDWDYTLYADTIDNLRGSTAYQLRQTLSRTGMGYYDTNVNGDFDAVRFIRGKYVKFPWTALYDGVLYGPDEWIVLGDRGTYNKGSTTNNKTGKGGSSLKSDGNLFNGQQVPYNVQNWSNYNQKEYHDLYKSFYDFYLPIVNDEQSLATVTYAIVAVNAPDDRDIMNSGGDSVLSAVGDFYKWVRSGTVSNRVRTLNRAEVGAGKVFKVDVVGRIGGFVVTDTTDVKFSDTFKKPLTPEEETTVVYDIDITDLYGTKAGRTTKALQASDSVINGGKLVDGPSGSPDRAVLTAASDWVGFNYSGGNARKFVITVKGNALQAGEFVVHVKDQANGAYTLRLADMTVNKKTSDEITVTVDVKNTTSAVDIRPRFNLIDTSVPNVYVTSMSIAIGGAGFSQGLNKVVDPTKQNFYLTDLTDVRGIYLGSTTTLNRATEGLGALAWQRYPNYTAVATALGDWIRMSDATQVRNANNVSGRSTPEYGTRGVDTYGGRPWIQQEDPLYKALASSGGKALVGPLTSDHNVIPQYNRPEAQLSVGSKVFFDVTTVGNYYDMSSELEIIPSYYLVDTTWKDANGAVALIPVDIYQLSSSGAYQPVNIFGAPYGGFTPAELDAFNQYRLSINWEEEAVGASNRRMVTNEEWQATETYANLFTDWIFEGDPYSDPDVDLDGTGGLPPVIGRTESPRKPPLGVMPIGGAQYIYQDYRTQTFIGSNYTYGVDKSGGLFSDYEADPTQNAKYIYWQLSAQRWHSTLGLPSDAVFVPLQQDPVTLKFNHVDTKDIVTHAVDISENLIICYLDIYANGTVWKLHYGNQGLQRTFSIGEQSYKLPLEGAPGPAMANPYPGQRTVGSDYLNGGIPFVIFGGSKVEGQADIIKTN